MYKYKNTISLWIWIYASALNEAMNVGSKIYF